MSRTSGSATIGTRTIKYSLEGTTGTITADSSQDVSTITSTVGTIVVRKERVLLNGKEVAALPEHARQVDIDYTAGKLTVTADGTTLPEAQVRR